jgi:CheY-like chemotaxis protein
LSALSGGSVKRPLINSEQVELFLVDDDPTFLAAAQKSCGDAGIHVAAIATARAAIERFFALGASETPSYMVVDLVMPRSNGKGILGGLEVLKRAADLDLAGRIYLALEDSHADAESVAKELGAAGIVRKAHPSGAVQAHDEPPLATYLNPVLERLRRAPLVATTFDLARELRVELGDTSGEWRTDGGKIIDENVRSLETLKALLGELNEPTFEEEIPLLVLRFASAFFVRGALFSVDKAKGELVGLGAFGLGVADPGRLVRSIKVPLAADTVFSRAFQEKAGVRQPFYDSEHNLRLISAFGGPRPREVYTAPLISPRGVENVIYADNATDPRAFPDIHLLEIFLQQSAAAIERSTLKNQLKRLIAASA